MSITLSEKPFLHSRQVRRKSGKCLVIDAAQAVHTGEASFELVKRKEVLWVRRAVQINRGEIFGSGNLISER
jgi:hypothetical protein